jgi:hypothetical protein
MLLGFRLHRFTPTVDGDFTLWWNKMARDVPRKQRKELNALVLLVMRTIWLERNNMVFDKFATMLMEVCRKIKEEFAQ